jgi:branched-chain amino acid transport system ATP-binding protein
MYWKILVLWRRTLADDQVYILSVEELDTGYGTKQVTKAVDLKVRPAEIVALIGHNGAGKSTILKAIFGLMPIWRGKVIYKDREINGRSTSENIKDGIVLVPQGNRVFTALTVFENLQMGAFTLANKQSFKEQCDRVFELFPALRNRGRQLAGTLSSGEKQMLALANMLILAPQLLLLDESSLGLSAILVQTAFEKIAQIRGEFHTAILIVEQKVRQVLSISDRAYVLKMGKVVCEGSSSDLLEGDQIQKSYL